MKEIKNIGIKAKLAYEKLKTIDHKKRQEVLTIYSNLLKKNKTKLIKQNLKDLKNAKRRKLIDRLILNEKRIEDIRGSISEIIRFKDPLNKVLDKWKRPNKLSIKKVSTSIGVMGVIYESRPNVTADVASLCLKSGNCVILRGGSEAFYTNKLLADLFRKSLKLKNIDQNCVQFIGNKNRKIVNYLLSKMQKYIDVIVPRGGETW